MELKEFFCMNEGDGELSYFQNFFFQVNFGLFILCIFILVILFFFVVNLVCLVELWLDLIGYDEI